DRGRPRNIDKAVVLALPILGAFALDLVGFYRLQEARLNLFLMPATLLLFGFGLQAVWAHVRLLVRRRRAPVRLPRRPYAAIAGALLILLAVRTATVSSGPFFTWDRDWIEDAQSAIAYLAEHTTPDDVIYVDTTMHEPLRFYRRFTPIDGPRLVLGNVGWPCCPRGVKLDRPAEPERTLPREVDRILDGGASGTLWMLHTGRDRWRQVGANYPVLLDERLRRRGCERLDSPTFEGIRLGRYRCD
ncbi:MAG: hypothetical protein R3349_03460, partial [Geminicoccaceae bacterium]|nr:hypothetical protein [Geminicoccaceae bacterium]